MFGPTGDGAALPKVVFNWSYTATKQLVSFTCSLHERKLGLYSPWLCPVSELENR